MERPDFRIGDLVTRDIPGRSLEYVTVAPYELTIGARYTFFGKLKEPEHKEWFMRVAPFPYTDAYNRALNSYEVVCQDYIVVGKARLREKD